MIRTLATLASWPIDALYRLLCWLLPDDPPCPHGTRDCPEYGLCQHCDHDIRTHFEGTE